MLDSRSTAWPCPCRRRFRTMWSRRSSCCRRPPWSSSRNAPPGLGRPGRPGSEDVDEDDEDDDRTTTTVSYVPIDPCQAVIAALRIAMGEHIAAGFIDLETALLRTSDGRAARSVRAEEGRPRAIRRGHVAQHLPPPHDGQPPIASATWPATATSWSSDTDPSCSSVRAGLALDSRSLLRTRRLSGGR